LIQICHKSLSAKTIPRREPGVWPVFARVFAFFGPRKTPRPSGQVNQLRAAVPKRIVWTTEERLGYVRQE
jgi:hypothetical protein